MPSHEERFMQRTYAYTYQHYDIFKQRSNYQNKAKKHIKHYHSVVTKSIFGSRSRCALTFSTVFPSMMQHGTCSRGMKSTFSKTITNFSCTTLISSRRTWRESETSCKRQRKYVSVYKEIRVGMAEYKNTMVAPVQKLAACGFVDPSHGVYSKLLSVACTSGSKTPFASDDYAFLSTAKNVSIQIHIHPTAQEHKDWDMIAQILNNLLKVLCLHVMFLLLLFPFLSDVIPETSVSLSPASSLSHSSSDTCALGFSEPSALATQD